MKKIYYLLLLPLLLTNCGNDDLILVEMPYRVEFDIPAGLSPFENWFFVFEDIPSNKLSLFANAGITDEDVTEIRGKSARLSTIFSDIPYDFIFDISVRIYKDDPDDYRELFYRTDVPLNISSQLDMIGGETDVQRYLENGSFNLLIRIVPRQGTTQVVESRLDFSMFAR